MTKPTIRPGDWVMMKDGDVHQAANVDGLYFYDRCGFAHKIAECTIIPCSPRVMLGYIGKSVVGGGPESLVQLHSKRMPQPIAPSSGRGKDASDS